MEHLDDIKKIDGGIAVRFCPYRGEMDWHVECIKERCMKFDREKGNCIRT